MVWKSVTCSKIMLPPKAIDLVLLLQGENKFGIVQIFALSVYGKQAGTVLLCRKTPAVFHPSTCTAASPAPHSKGRQGLLCARIWWDWPRNRVMATVCQGLSSPGLGWGCCISPVHLPRPTSGLSHTPWDSPGLPRHSSSLFPFEYLWDSVWKQSLMKICLSKMTQMCTCNATKGTFTETNQLCSFIS